MIGAAPILDQDGSFVFGDLDRMFNAGPFHSFWRPRPDGSMFVVRMGPVGAFEFEGCLGGETSCIGSDIVLIGAL
jgi:hypothetical protein